MRTLFSVTTLLLFAGPALANDGTFEIDKSETIMAVGKKATTSVTITAKKGWHLNQEAPFTLKLSPPAGVTVEKAKLVRADLAVSSETSARFDVGVTIAEPGKKRIEAEAGFVLCQKDACRPIKEKLTITAEATSPPAAPTKKTGAAAKKKKG
jgi:hypothetical protein